MLAVLSLRIQGKYSNRRILHRGDRLPAAEVAFALNNRHPKGIRDFAAVASGAFAVISD